MSDLEEEMKASIAALDACCERLVAFNEFARRIEAYGSAKDLKAHLADKPSLIEAVLYAAMAYRQAKEDLEAGVSSKPSTFEKLL